MSCQVSAKQQHNARYQFGDATIRYGFHLVVGKRSLLQGAMVTATKSL